MSNIKELNEQIETLKRLIQEERRQYDIRVWKNIKSVRERNGYTQKEFGELLGLSREKMGQIETGRLQLKVKVLIEICQLLDESADEILGLDAADHKQASRALKVGS